MNGAIDSGSGSIPSAIWVIVTLPQMVISYTSPGSTPASAHTSCVSCASVSWARAWSASSAPSSSIVADTREITSAPNGCWRFSIDSTAIGWPVSRSSSVATTVVVPRSNAMAKRRVVVSPGSTSISRSSQTTAVTSKPFSRSTLPSVRSTGSSTRGSRSSSASITRCEVRALVLERRLLQHEVPLLHRGPQDHVPPDAHERRLRPRLERRHLDHELAARRRAAGEPPAVVQLVGRERTRVDRRDGQLALDHAHLALLARAVAAAGGVDRDAVPAGRVEHRRARGHAHLLALRLEADVGALGAVGRRRQSLSGSGG